MKILWIIEKYFDIALDKSARIGMLHSLTKKQHNVIILTGFKKNKEPILPNIKLLTSIKLPFLHYLSLNIYIFVWALYYMLKRKPDVIICCHMSVFIGLFLKIISNIIGRSTKFILDIRTIPVEIKGIKGRLTFCIFDFNIYFAKYFFDGITVISNQMKLYIVNKYKISKKIGIWSSAVDLSLFSPEIIENRKLLNIKNKINPENKFVLMYHGVITKNRGLDKVIEAVKIIKWDSIDIYFIIIGNGNAKYELMDMVKKYNLSSSIKFIEQVALPEVPYYIFCCDIGILPFPNLIWWRVSSPLKLMEYLAMGKPVIATDIEAHRDVIGSQNCAFIIKDNKPETIADAIKTAYNKRTELTKMGMQGRKIILEQYTWDKQAENLIKYLSTI